MAAQAFRTRAASKNLARASTEFCAGEHRCRRVAGHSSPLLFRARRTGDAPWRRRTRLGLFLDDFQEYNIVLDKGIECFSTDA
jgi:hypothetical protein